MSGQKYVIRKGGIEGLYVQKDGSLGRYRTAKKFSRQDMANTFAEKHIGSDFGLFSRKCAFDKKRED